MSVLMEIVVSTLVRLTMESPRRSSASWVIVANCQIGCLDGRGWWYEGKYIESLISLVISKNEYAFEAEMSLG